MQPISAHEARARVLVVAERLETEVLRLEATRDSRATFAFTYKTMTLRIAAALEGDSGMDPAWCARIVELFAERFFVASAAWDSGGTLPAGWAYILDALAHRRTSVLEEMVLGMAAHILYDLPLAVVELTEEGVDLEATLRDYHRMNDVLGDSIDAIQAEVAARYQPHLAFLDVLVGNQDEILSNYGIRLSRGMAWYNAKRLLDTDAREAVEASIARAPEALAKALMEPAIAGWLFRLIRWFSALFRRWPAPA